MKRILFVCLGNICRSPMAEFVFRDKSRRAGTTPHFMVGSAGISDEEAGNPVYPPAARVLSEHGIACFGKRARRMTADDYRNYDLLVGMETRHLQEMRHIAGGDPEGKIVRLLDYTDDPHDIADPWYSGDFDGVYAEIEKGCEALLQALRPV